MLGFRAQLVAWIAAGLRGVSPAQAANYSVSPSGSDSAPGTLSQPFRTIQKAASIMVAGDTAFIRAGVYRETVTPKNSGTQNAPITCMPYNGESVTVSGADVIPASSWTLSSGNIYKAPMSAASMGPRSIDCGIVESALRAYLAAEASMGPRSIDRGIVDLNSIKAGMSPASMGPRSIV